MRNSSQIWCETSDISLELIDQRAREEFEAGNFVTTIFISPDLLAELSKQVASITRYTGISSIPSHGITSCHTTVGHLIVEKKHKLKNFLLVGRLEDFVQLEEDGIDRRFLSDQERDKMNKAFEDLMILEGKDG